jgi:hypothetical protein
MMPPLMRMAKLAASKPIVLMMRFFILVMRIILMARMTRSMLMTRWMRSMLVMRRMRFMLMMRSIMVLLVLHSHMMTAMDGAYTIFMANRSFLPMDPFMPLCMLSFPCTPLFMLLIPPAITAFGNSEPSNKDFILLLQHLQGLIHLPFELLELSI